MITEANPIFRITYEAFSKFSNELNRCRKFEEITECFTLYLKYLFNYHVFRASYSRNDTYVHVESVAGNTTLTIDNKPDYLEYEKQLLKTDIPQKWNDLSDLQLPQSFLEIPEEQPELWGWNFSNKERHTIVSVYFGCRKKFFQKDINVLKLVADNLETKLLEFCLINELDEKNNIISRIVEHQKEIIKDRTIEIEEKNKTLLEISVLNAHHIREPLTRIVGLIDLIEVDYNEELIKEIIPLLKISSNDLDTALKRVIDHAAKDLMRYKT